MAAGAGSLAKAMAKRFQNRHGKTPFPLFYGGLGVSKSHKQLAVGS